MDRRAEKSDRIISATLVDQFVNVELLYWSQNHLKTRKCSKICSYNLAKSHSLNTRSRSRRLPLSVPATLCSSRHSMLTTTEVVMRSELPTLRVALCLTNSCTSVVTEHHMTPELLWTKKVSSHTLGLSFTVLQERANNVLDWEWPRTRKAESSGCVGLRWSFRGTIIAWIARSLKVLGNEEKAEVVTSYGGTKGLTKFGTLVSDFGQGLQGWDTERNLNWSAVATKAICKPSETLSAYEQDDELKLRLHFRLVSNH